MKLSDALWGATHQNVVMVAGGAKARSQTEHESQIKQLSIIGDNFPHFRLLLLLHFTGLQFASTRALHENFIAAEIIKYIPATDKMKCKSTSVVPFSRVSPASNECYHFYI